MSRSQRGLFAFMYDGGVQRILCVLVLTHMTVIHACAPVVMGTRSTDPPATPIDLAIHYRGIFVTSNAPIYFAKTTTAHPWVSVPTAPWIGEIRGTQFVPFADRYDSLMCLRYPSMPAEAECSRNVVRAVVNAGHANELVLTHSLGSRGGGLSLNRRTAAGWAPAESFIGLADVEGMLPAGPTGDPVFMAREYACPASTGKWSRKCEARTGLRFFDSAGARVGPPAEDRLAACAVATSNGAGILSYGGDDRTGTWLALWTRAGEKTLAVGKDARGPQTFALVCRENVAFLDGSVSIPIPGKQTEIVTGVFAPAHRSERVGWRVDGLNAAPTTLALAPLPAANLGLQDTFPPPPPGMKCRVVERMSDQGTFWAIEECDRGGMDEPYVVEQRLISTLENAGAALSVPGAPVGFGSPRAF